MAGLRRFRGSAAGEEAAASVGVRGAGRGSEKGVTVTDNIGAFSELGFAPHVAGLSAQRDLSTTVMGQPVSLPVLIGPTGVQGAPRRGRWP